MTSYISNFKIPDMAHEAPEWKATPDALPKFRTEDEGIRFSLSLSSSLHKDLEYVMSLTGKSIDVLTSDLTSFTLGATRLAQSPGYGLFRKVGGFEELVSIHNVEYDKDVDWQTEEKDGKENHIELCIDSEQGEMLIGFARSCDVGVNTLFNRIYRMGISFYRDIEEYGIPFYVKENNRALPFDYSCLMPE